MIINAVVGTYLIAALSVSLSFVLFNKKSLEKLKMRQILLLFALSPLIFLRGFTKREKRGEKDGK